jgi:reactive intermediate/imine deaminase
MTENVTRRRVIVVDNVWKPAGPYSHGVVVGKTVHVTGCIGLLPENGQLAPGGIEAETHQTLKNIGNILRAAGTDYSNVVKATVFLTDIKDWPAVNSVYQQYFPDRFPARSAVQVVALPRDAKVEIECKAILGKLVDE